MTGHLPDLDTSTKSGGVKLVLCVQISLLSDMMWSCKYVPLTVFSFGLEVRVTTVLRPLSCQNVPMNTGGMSRLRSNYLLLRIIFGIVYCRFFIYN